MAKKDIENKLPDFLQELEEKFKYQHLGPSFYEDLNFNMYSQYTLDRNQVDWLCRFLYDAFAARIESNFKFEAFEIFKNMLDFMDWGDESIKDYEKFKKEREDENNRRDKLKKAQEAKEKAAAKKKAKVPAKKSVKKAQ